MKTKETCRFLGFLSGAVHFSICLVHCASSRGNWKV